MSFRTVQELVIRIRLNILEQMNRLSADYHETTPVGEKLYRMKENVDQVFGLDIKGGVMPDQGADEK